MRDRIKTVLIGSALALASVGAAEASDACGGLIEDEVGTYANVPLVALLANPREYDGCTVQTVGVVNADPTALFISPSDQRVGLALNAVALILDAESPPNLRPLVGQMAIVKGRFRHTGPLQVGALDRITKIVRFDGGG